jgi:hypothetical protein
MTVYSIKRRSKGRNGQGRDVCVVIVHAEVFAFSVMMLAVLVRVAAWWRLWDDGEQGLEAGWESMQLPKQRSNHRV